MRFKQAGVFIVIFISLLGVSFAQDIESVKEEIYSQINCCPCKEGFAKCTCPEAKERKVYIEALLEAGVGKEEICYKVAKKYSLAAIKDGRIRAEVEKRLLGEAGAKRPQLMLKASSFDFGQLSKNQGMVKKAFTISNKGTEALVIKNIRTFCPCLTVVLKTRKEISPSFGPGGAAPGWQGVIGPGEAGELEVAVDLLHASIKPGKLIREVRVFSNDPLYPETLIMLAGEVKE